jgi:hypothetical protein
MYHQIRGRGGQALVVLLWLVAFSGCGTIPRRPANTKFLRVAGVVLPLPIHPYGKKSGEGNIITETSFSVGFAITDASGREWKVYRDYRDPRSTTYGSFYLNASPGKFNSIRVIDSETFERVALRGRPRWHYTRADSGYSEGIELFREMTRDLGWGSRDTERFLNVHAGGGSVREQRLSR